MAQVATSARYYLTLSIDAKDPLTDVDDFTLILACYLHRMLG